jgi:hypothetical protein
MLRLSNSPILIALCAGFIPAISVFGMENCSVKSAATLTPVIELYTSEGCSSCPPADAWLSTLKAAHKEGKVVAQAFHVNYWDYIGWKDRFAAPAHTQRQRELSARTRLNSIYTPQFAKNGITVRDTGDAQALIASKESAQASIALKQLEVNRFEAVIEPAQALGPWTAHFTVTEHEHLSKVTAGENKGETLKNDFVVRQYVRWGNSAARFEIQQPRTDCDCGQNASASDQSGDHRCENGPHDAGAQRILLNTIFTSKMSH